MTRGKYYKDEFASRQTSHSLTLPNPLLSVSSSLVHILELLKEWFHRAAPAAALRTCAKCDRKAELQQMVFINH